MKLGREKIHPRIYARTFLHYVTYTSRGALIIDKLYEVIYLWI